MDDAIVCQRLLAIGDDVMLRKKQLYGEDAIRLAQKRLLLYFLDRVWKEHLQTLDHVRQGISLRAYAQRDPLNEYRGEAFSLFGGMLESLKNHVTAALCHLAIEGRASMPASPMAARRVSHGAQTSAPRKKDTKRRLAMPRKKMKKKRR